MTSMRICSAVTRRLSRLGQAANVLQRPGHRAVGLGHSLEPLALEHLGDTGAVPPRLADALGSPPPAEKRAGRSAQVAPASLPWALRPAGAVRGRKGHPVTVLRGQMLCLTAPTSSATALVAIAGSEDRCRRAARGRTAGRAPDSWRRRPGATSRSGWTAESARGDPAPGSAHSSRSTHPATSAAVDELTGHRNRGCHVQVHARVRSHRR